jgi:hypothetical protein
MQKVRNIALITGIILAVVIIAIIVIGVLTGHMIDVLYVSLIIVALFTLAVTVLQILTIVELMRSISTVRNEMKPLMASVQETVGVAKETVGAVQDLAKSAGHTVAVVGTAARFTNDLAVAPSVRVVATLLAIQRTLRVFFGRGHVGSRVDERRRQQLEVEVAGGE